MFFVMVKVKSSSSILVRIIGKLAGGGSAAMAVGVGDM